MYKTFNSLVHFLVKIVMQLYVAYGAEKNPNIFLIASDKTCVNLVMKGLSLKLVVNLLCVEIITGSSVESVSKQGVVNFRRYALFSWGGKRFHYRFVCV